jgi:putative tryptophan/tyrosine transport system substrate-binding protein
LQGRGRARQGATYVDQALKGARSAGLPIEQPEESNLVINLEAASAPGIPIPQSIRQRADEAIP